MFRNREEFPICKTCFSEELEEEWEDDFAEYILEQIENRFNRNYNKWSKWFHENHVLCDGEHEDYAFYYEAKEAITVIDDKNYCRNCIDEINEVKSEK